MLKLMTILGLAMAAVTDPYVPALFDFEAEQLTTSAVPLSLFEILREFYDSDTLHPVMPYEKDALFGRLVKDTQANGRPEAIRALVAKWFGPAEGPAHLASKHDELTWFATLIVAGSGRMGRAPRLDFYLMHILTSSLFIPSLLKLVPKPEMQVKLMKAYLAVALFDTIARGRPRIDAELMMTYSATPAPPASATRHMKFPPSPAAVSDPNDSAIANRWDVIVPCALLAPDSHIVKVVRALYDAAQRLGHTAAGEVPGAVDDEEKETLKGLKGIDGTVFVRAAGVAMDALGWVTYGEKDQWWDGSGLGWDDAWKDD